MSLVSQYTSLSLIQFISSTAASPQRLRDAPTSIPTTPAALPSTLPSVSQDLNTPSASGSPLPPPSPALLSPHILIPQSTSYGSTDISPPVPDTPIVKKPKSLFYPSASTSLSPTSTGAGTTLTYHLITPQLALLALLPTAVFDSKRGLVEYNVVFFREGIQEICDVEEEARRRT